LRERACPGLDPGAGVRGHPHPASPVEGEEWSLVSLVKGEE